MNDSARSGEDFFCDFVVRARERLAMKLHTYRTLCTQKYSGYLYVYFTNALPETEEQPVPYMFQFPYPLVLDESPKASKGFFGSLVSTSPVKKRWCTVDADNFSYCFSRSRTKVKDKVPLQALRMIVSPYTKSMANSPTSLPDECIALVYREKVIVLRADSVAHSMEWIQVFRARLLKPEIWKRLNGIMSTS